MVPALCRSSLRSWLSVSILSLSSVGQIGSAACGCVQREVEVQDVDAWLAEEPERTSLGVCGDQSLNLRNAQAPHSGDAGDLLLGVGRADLGVEAGPAGQQRVRGDLGGVDAVQGGGGGPAVLDGGDQVLVLRAQVGGTAGRGVVSQ